MLYKSNFSPRKAKRMDGKLQLIYQQFLKFISHHDGGKWFWAGVLLAQYLCKLRDCWLKMLMVFRNADWCVFERQISSYIMVCPQHDGDNLSLWLPWKIGVFLVSGWVEKLWSFLTHPIKVYHWIQLAFFIMKLASFIIPWCCSMILSLFSWIKMSEEDCESDFPSNWAVWGYLTDCRGIPMWFWLFSHCKNVVYVYVCSGIQAHRTFLSVNYLVDTNSLRQANSRGAHLSSGDGAW